MAEKTTYDELKERVQNLESQISTQNRFWNISRTLFKISNAVNTTPNIEALYKSIHDELSSVIDTTNFFIAIYDKTQDSITFPYCVDSIDECYPPVIEISKTESLTAKVIRTGLPLWITKDEILNQRQKSQRKIPDCTPSELWLGVPLKIEIGVIGVMAVQSYDDANHYDQTDLEVMVSVADQVALVIENKRSEKTLRESEGRFRMLSQYSRTGIYIHVGGLMKFVNNRFAEILGYTPEEIVGRQYWDFVHHGDREMVKKISLDRSRGEAAPLEYEFRHLNKDGETVWVHNLPTIVQYQGQTANMGNLTQINDRIKAEEKQRKLIADLQKALENVKTLSGLLPICSNCKKIRDDKGYWNQIEDYIHKHSDAEFSHGICQKCAEKLYPDLDLSD